MGEGKKTRLKRNGRGGGKKSNKTCFLWSGNNSSGIQTKSQSIFIYFIFKRNMTKMIHPPAVCSI